MENWGNFNVAGYTANKRLAIIALRSPYASPHTASPPPTAAMRPRRSCRTQEAADGEPVDCGDEGLEVDIRRSPAMKAAQRARQSNGTLMANLAVGGVALLAAFAFITVVLQAAVVGVGVVNPAWQTFKALESKESETGSESSDDDDYVPPGLHAANWAAYWVVAALLYLSSVVVALPAGLVSVPAPLVPAVLLPMLLYLTRDNAAQSRRVYDEFARPAFRMLEASVDGSVNAAVQHVEHLTGVALVQLYAAVEPYAQQLRQAATTHARLIAEK